MTNGQSKPHIGITGPDEGGYAAWLLTSTAVRWQGGFPIRIMPRNYKRDISIDGLIIGGGADIAPGLYGAEPIERSKSSNRALRARDFIVAPLLWTLRVLTARWWKEPKDASLRDELEAKLIKKMLEEGKPLLGICRGAQLINVILGGSLYQDLTNHYDETPEIRTILPRRTIYLKSGSILQTIFRSSILRVNALHRQAVHKVGRDLWVTARDRNGIIQAIEKKDRPFVIGVQWHPEYLPQSQRQRELFRVLVRHAQGKIPKIA